VKVIEVIADAGSADTLEAIAEKSKAWDARLLPAGDPKKVRIRITLTDDKVQLALDRLQSVLGAQVEARILVFPVDITLPAPAQADRQEEDTATAAREALYTEVERSAHLGADYLVLVILSTLVAAIGLIENNVAVLIGAMVIAPLLGPNLALGLGATLGDFPLLGRALLTLLVGIGVAVAMGAGIGAFWSHALDSPELISRTSAGLDSVALALASGAAGALSLTTRLSSVLVGVMVAVALLPPATAVGLMLGADRLSAATGAGLLLAINIVCLNLASQLVFLLKGIRPRTWLEKTRARRAIAAQLVMWPTLLAILVVAIYTHHRLKALTILHHWVAMTIR
jgi:uncharacterized hydrophobic protein (TIGR00341 family)